VAVVPQWAGLSGEYHEGCGGTAAFNAGIRQAIALLGVSAAVAALAGPALADGTARAGVVSSRVAAGAAAGLGSAEAGDGTGLLGAVSAPVLPVTLLGGTDVVSSFQETRLARVGGSSTRLAGPDRYATAVAVSKAMASNPVAEVVLASGAAFPDVLSGAPLAARLGGPLLITSPTSLPTVVGQELGRLHPSRITVLGGTGAVSAAVAAAPSWRPDCPSPTPWSVARPPPSSTPRSS
jgi:Cell wall binding domain 2 (CWB2)